MNSPIREKIAVTPTKSLETQHDLAPFAYTPGVAEPCLEIEKILQQQVVILRVNLVAVISNGYSRVRSREILVRFCIKTCYGRKGVLFKNLLASMYSILNQ